MRLNIFVVGDSTFFSCLKWHFCTSPWKHRKEWEGRGGCVWVCICEGRGILCLCVYMWVSVWELCVSMYDCVVSVWVFYASVYVCDCMGGYMWLKYVCECVGVVCVCVILCVCAGLCVWSCVCMCDCVWGLCVRVYVWLCVCVSVWVEVSMLSRPGLKYLLTEVPLWSLVVTLGAAFGLVLWF